MITVLGGKGYIGSNFVRGRIDLVENERSDYNVTENDVVNFVSTITNYNVLRDPFIDIDTNLRVLMATLDSWRKLNPTGVYNFLSSWFVYGDYGDASKPVREDALCNPKGFYSITKRAAEQLLISYCETFKLKYRIMRIANVIGGVDPKASKEKNALQWMLNKIRDGEDVSVYESGKLVRDYMFVSDVITAINLVMDKGEVNTIYNLGNGDPIIFSDILETAKRVANSKSNLTSIPIPEFHRIVQVRDMYMDTTKLKALGYKPTRDFKVDIENVVKELMYG